MLELKDIIVLVPKSIKLELIKDEMKKIYLTEIDANAYIKKYNILNMWLFIKTCKETFNPVYKLYVCYKEMIEAIKNANLTEDELIDIYLWGKKVRKELNLEDNLFNIHSDYIPINKRKHQEIYEKINKRNTL